ncbi:MAG: ribose 5-phosphate isomerase B [Candidatus Omnitrophica bacterium]|nr:ribose 5-phosphate isomerase B [Candidatus Omnitrophota bacterium]MCF7876849.1 ribose 5-phosphate isomerase B [Candidatus Omnitrophota bacterium]MCF7877892.1 ribose 5-phosphate isomerase B [Candidatus Omnitrophota bacterium]MCF7893098.1 ribose 5-phosphate isomerase B [Candidatus Omnitrophota bacterium]
MRIAFGCDHRGFKLKNILINYLENKGHKILDFGTFSKDSCDYPDYIYPAVSALANKKADKAIVICFTGIGSCILANKIKGIRAALVYNIKSAKFSRRHNDSNVLVLAADLFKADYAKKLVLSWLKESFEGGRHSRRLRKIKKVEEL